MRGPTSHALTAALVAVVLLATLVPGTGGVRAGLPHPTALPGHSTALRPPPARPSVAAGPVNWAQYMGGPTHTGSNPWERTIAPSNVSNLTQVWSFASNGSLSSAPIVVNGTVYVGSWAAYEYAVEASNGTQRWASYLNTTTSCSVGGIDSTPAYSNGSLYLGAPNGTWVALNASNGSVDWSFLAGAGVNGYYDWASALVFGHSLYIGTASCFDSPLIPGSLLQVNLTGNHTANHTWHAVAPGHVGTSIWTTATADPLTNTLWVTTGNDPGTAQKYSESMVALNATDLSVRGYWQVPNVVGSDSDFGSTATLVTPSTGPPLVVATNKNGVAYAFNRSNVTATNWSPAWSLNTGGGFSGGAFDGTTLYLAGLYGVVYAVFPSNGSVKWQTNLAGGIIYPSLTTANGLVYVGAGATEYALDAASGKPLWNATPPGATIDGESVVANGRLFVPVGDSGGGHLYAYGLPFAIAANGSIPNATTAPATGLFRGNATGGMLPYTFAWSFDDGGTSSAATVLHTFQVPGNHSGRLTVTDSAGVVRHLNVTVLTTRPPPVLRAFIHSSTVFGEAPLSVRFNGSQVNGSGAPYNWTWDFGDHSGGSGAAILHTFAVGGWFAVVLNLSESGGAYAVANVSIHVLPLLTVGAMASPGYGPAPFTTQLTAIPFGGLAPYNVQWSFGDASAAASGPIVNHTYLLAGNFTANATVSDGFGVVVTTSVVVATTSVAPTPPPPPLAAHPFAIVGVQQCHPRSTQVRLTANASGGVGADTETWTFGDGAPVQHGPVSNHTYAAVSGTFGPIVTVVDANGTTITAPLSVQLPTLSCPPSAATSNSGGGLTATELGLLAAGAIVLMALVAVVVYRRRLAR
ncbi:MAG: PKD domain-containing protein [Thermoplasmata archaeon]|nr:PKD domain-containing protein [Thermoplasmata archaeon]MCI4357025.1 PKD domain-containing protein [Thermoplasmata archaeon]